MFWQLCSHSFVDDSQQVFQLPYMDWGENISVFNACSGETHLLNLFPFEILKYLSKGTASFEAVSEYLAQICDEENTPSWQEKVHGVMHQLEELEFIEAQA